MRQQRTTLYPYTTLFRSIENRRAEIEACIGRCDTGDGVVLLTDMFGGTPSNLAISMMERKGVEVIAGVNLPMLDRKSTRLNSSHPSSSYAVFCLKKKSVC